MPADSSCEDMVAERAIRVFEYTDFRAFLADYYAAEKARRSSFSFRAFARRAGFASPNFLKLVIDGRRNIGEDSIPRFVRALGLDREEGRFFASLVGFGQSRTVEDRNQHFEKIAASRRFRAARKIDGALFEYLSHWYMPAIRELAARVDFREDPEWIGEQLLPAIRPADARKALTTLVTLGLLVRDDTGRLSRGEPTLTTGHDVQSLSVINYHRQMLERAASAIEALPSSRREFGAMTVCVRSGTVAELKERIRRFCEEILERSDRDAQPDAVFQINVQLFQLSRCAEVTSQ
ncbi:MAG: TIGR02147 family protein [Deltaproteobacteria bacterium]|nr:TIGR02147 family protein [Deltaproteobacteria bacterium]